MTPFFVGWSGRSALRVLGFLGPVAATVLIGFGALAFALAVGTGDPGGGDVMGEMRIEGTLIADPYPMIVTDADQHTVLLSGGGKRGVQVRRGRWMANGSVPSGRMPGAAIGTCCWCTNWPRRRERQSPRCERIWGRGG